MDVNPLHKAYKEIKFYLVFFCLTLVVACGRGGAVHIERIDYENEDAVGVTFTTEMDIEKLRVFLGEESQTSVIGVIVSVNDEHRFMPAIPFTAGQTYTLRKADTLVLASFEIPERAKSEAAELLAMYPKGDTVPENLLKMYLEFAQPMQEVNNALDFISVTNETDGIDTKPFLRLESELWNRERTVLTLWLDPGRIKTDLIPNREKGLPLVAGKEYTITIDNKWKSIEGAPLKQVYTKKFVVGPRDDKKPDTNEWQLRLQKEDSVKSLHVDFGESLDAFLARETIHIYKLNGTEVKGAFSLLENERVLRFVPEDELQTPEIELQVESRLEDLAGNNLNRLFDNPIEAIEPQNNDSLEVYTIRLKLEL